VGRILAVDYGSKRTGIAVTDALKIIATPLSTIPTSRLIDFLTHYLSSEQVETILIGDPKRLNAQPTHCTQAVHRLTSQLKNLFPHIEIKLIDERFTSRMAQKEIAAMGLKKSKRRDKALTDRISAVILLQGYLNSVKK
jgi:putative Holliday junction resolvase